MSLAPFALAERARPIDDSALKNAGKRGDQWLIYGLDPGETRFSPLKKIDAGNVKRLGLAWAYEAGRGGGNQEATPLFWDGVLYAITNWSVTFAVDARTGKELWRWDPKVDQAATRPKICCGVVNRGLAIYQGKIIAPAIDGRLVALDAKTGAIVWQAQVSSVEEHYTLTMAPRIAKGKVIIGVAGAEYPNRGYFDAYDANTGKHAWRFYTVPGDPSKPYENEALKRAAETWSGDFWKIGGGGSVWDAISYDPETELVYVGTGNPGPWPEALRKTQGQDNLYTCSILAVDVNTGNLRWHYQVIPGDSWDFDSVQQLTLADLSIGGKKRKVIMQANKNGFFYVLDRVTGELISAEPYATVNWAKEIDKKTGRPVVNEGARYAADPVTIAPGPGGGHNWAPMAFNPKTGLVYIPSTTASAWVFSVDQKFVHKPGRMNLGLGGSGGAGKAGTPPMAAPPGHAGNEGPDAAAADGSSDLPVVGPLVAAGTPSRAGFLVAWDPVAQKERWRAPGGGNFPGGVVTTAANLVLQVVPDGRLVAYTADKGEKLLEIQTGLKGGMGPPITYELDGKQYVTLMGGQGSASKPAYEEAQGTPPPASTVTVPPKMLTFALDANAPMPWIAPAE
jgi:quinohemoprotein ethanol dehydrogenase